MEPLDVDILKSGHSMHNYYQETLTLCTFISNASAVYAQLLLYITVHCNVCWELNAHERP